MSEPLEPISPDLAALLEAERQRPDPPPGSESAVYSRLWETLAHVPSADGGGNAAPGNSVAPVASSGWVKTLVTLLVGAAAGGGVQALYDRRAAAPAPPPLSGERDLSSRTTSGAAPPVSSTAPLASQPAEEPERSQPPTRPVAGPSGPSGTTARPTRPAEITRPMPLARDQALGAERALIEQARTALVRGDGERALQALARHQHQFAQGALGEEREGLVVQALVRLERYDEARRAGETFHRRFPRSIFGPVVDESLRSIP